MLKYFREIIDKNPVSILLIVYATVIIYKVLCLFIPLDSHVDFFIAYVCTIIGAAVTVAGLGWTYIYEKDKDKIIAERNKIPNIIISAKPKKVSNGMLESLDISVISDGPGTAMNVFLEYIDVKNYPNYKRQYVGSLTAKSSKSFEIECDNRILNSDLYLYFTDIENKSYYRNILVSTLKDCTVIDNNIELYIHHSIAFPGGISTEDSNIVFILDCNPLSERERYIFYHRLRHTFGIYSVPLEIEEVKDTYIYCITKSDFSVKLAYGLIKDTIGIDVLDYEVVSGDAKLL